MLDNNQVYVIVDIETDGPVAGLHSILSIGAVASTKDEEVGEFYQKLLPIKDARQDADTIEWWNKHPEAWQEVTTDVHSADEVIKSFYAWVVSLGATPVFVASPIVFDYSFVHWYLHRFIGNNPFEDYSGVQRTLDLASFTAGRLNAPLSRARRSQLADKYKEGMPPHSHKAIDDARGYGVLLRNILNS